MEVLSDPLGSLGVVVAAIVLMATGLPYIDPIVGVIGLFILPRACRLGREALRVLLQVAPSEIDVAGIEHATLQIEPPGFADTKDLVI